MRASFSGVYSPIRALADYDNLLAVKNILNTVTVYEPYLVSVSR